MKTHQMQEEKVGRRQMEQRAPADDFLSPATQPSLTTLATLRSLIINPNTPRPLLSSLLQTLTFPNGDPTPHTPPLVTALALVHPTFAPLVISSLLCVLRQASPPVALSSLSSLRALSPGSLAAFDDRSFTLFCWSDDARVRKWVVENIGLFVGVERRVIGILLTVMAGDPFPEVRRGALEGLVRLKLLGGLGTDDDEIVKGCFWRGVEMSTDAENSVRRAAVRVVSEWGQMLALDKQGEEKRAQFDVIFIQLCSLARDMDIEVRIEAFKALENLETVSSDLLLQSLSKRELNVVKENGTPIQSTKQIIYSAANVAGVLVHGLEDEFYEVRRSVCQALQRLGTLSSAFAVEAMNYLMDMLNDDEIAVRLQALETMHCMAAHDHLFIPSAHMHMFLGCLNVNSSPIRYAVRKVMKVAKLSNLDFFEASVHGLIKNLETYPQDEDDVMSVLFNIGQYHGEFLMRIFSEVSHEIEPTSGGNLNFDSARVAALLVLAISAPLSHKHQIGIIPATMFSYAVTLLGRISCALPNVDKQRLLVYFSECSRGTNHSVAGLREALSLNLAKGGAVNPPGLAKNGHIAEKSSSEMLKMLSQCVVESNGLLAPNAEYRPNKNSDLLSSVKVIYNEVLKVWILIKSGHRSEAVWTLRVYEEQLLSFVNDESCGALSFAIQYVRVLKLLAEIWGHIHPSGFHYNRTFGEWEILMVGLERTVGDMRCLFTGFSRQEELYLLELVLVALLLRLSKIDNCGHAIFAARKLTHTWVVAGRFLKENAVKPTPFLSELNNVLPEHAFSVGNILSTQSIFRKMVDLFSPMQFELSGSLDLIYAELAVYNNSSENPQIFVQGLPVAIPLEITLHDVSKESRLWLKMMILGKEDSRQFVYLDPGLVPRGSNEPCKSTYVFSFYKTPKAPNFSLTVCLGMECMLDDVVAVDSRCWGPKRELTFLCPEKEVYFSTLINTNQRVP